MSLIQAPSVRAALVMALVAFLVDAIADARMALAACTGPAGFAVLEREAATATIDTPRLLALLRGRLGAAGLGLCFDEPPPGVPTAVIRLRSGGDGAVAIEIRAVGGDIMAAGAVDLRALPPDGHTLAVATIADELLRATQARRSSTDPPAITPMGPAPLAGQAAVPAARAPYDITVAVAGSQFQGGLGSLGPDLQAGVAVIQWLGARVHLGYRWAGDTRAPHGTVTPQALTAGAGLRERLPSPWTGVRLALQQQVDLVRVRFAALASPGQRAASTSLNALVASAGMVAAAPLRGRIALVLQMAACYAIVGARARDDGRGVVALDGFGGEVAVGLALEL